MTLRRQDLSNTMPGPCRRQCGVCGKLSPPVDVWPSGSIGHVHGWGTYCDPREKGSRTRHDICPKCVFPLGAQYPSRPKP